VARRAAPTSAATARGWLTPPRLPTPAISLEGTVEQASYLGHGWRHRVRLAGGSVWVDDPAQVAEGSRTHVVVPRDALLMFPNP
jgi:hypothetical protein